MKKVIIFNSIIALFILFLNSCKCKWNNDANNIESMIGEFNHGLHDISYGEFLSLTTNYTKVFDGYARQKSVGYAFPMEVVKLILADTINGQSPDKGLFYVYCYDDKSTMDTSDDVVFIAIKYLSGFTYKEDFLSKMDPDEEFLPINISFKYTEEGLVCGKGDYCSDTCKITAFLHKPCAYELLNLKDTYKKSEIYTFYQKFGRSFLAYDNLNPTLGRTICNSESFGFISIYDIKKFYQQPKGDQASYVHLYWGIDPNLNQNKIRSILTLAKDKKPILSITGAIASDPTKVTRTIYFERAWP